MYSGDHQSLVRTLRPLHFGGQGKVWVEGGGMISIPPLMPGKFCLILPLAFVFTFHYLNALGKGFCPTGH
jgi:hypothetical protein